MSKVTDLREEVEALRQAIEGQEVLVHAVHPFLREIDVGGWDAPWPIGIRMALDAVCRWLEEITLNEWK